MDLMANFLPLCFSLSVINTIRFLTYLLYIIEMGGCYSTMLELPELLVFPIPSLIDNTGFLIIHRG